VTHFLGHPVRLYQLDFSSSMIVDLNSSKYTGRCTAKPIRGLASRGLQFSISQQLYNLSFPSVNVFASQHIWPRLGLYANRSLTDTERRVKLVAYILFAHCSKIKLTVT